jgi:hypothetical protein
MARRNIFTPEGIARYANVFTPRARKDSDGNPKGEAKYSLLLVFPRDVDLSELEEAVEAAAKEKFGKNYQKALSDGTVRGFNANPIRNASDYIDEEKTKEENWPFNLPGAKMIRFASKESPGVVDENGITMENKSNFYDGCKARVSCRAFAYDNESKGVSFALVNVQRLGEGKRLSGNPSAEEEFGMAVKPGKPAPKKRVADDEDDDI